MSKKTWIAAAIIIAVIAGIAVFTAAKVRPDSSGSGDSRKYTEENRQMLEDTVNIKDKYTEQIADLFEQIEPGCRFISIEEDAISGGIMLYITTDSGKQYSVNTASDGEIGNITDMSTEQMLYPSESLPKEEDGDDLPDVCEMNMDMLYTYGIEQGTFTKQDAELVVKWLDRAAPNELIKSFSVEISGGDKIFHIKTDGNKDFDVTVYEDGSASIIEQY